MGTTRPAVAALAGALVVSAACAAPAAPPRPPSPVVDEPARVVHLRVRAGSALRIGSLPTFSYDGRRGSATGTMQPGTGGRWDVRLDRSRTWVAPLPMIPAFPGLPLRVEIEPRDLVGEFDPCTGEASLSFDATFRPVAFDLRPAPLSVVTPLTTGTSSGDAVTVTGRPADATGHLRLAGVARVPPTGDPFVDALLGLPADAVAELEADLDVEGGLPPCPGRPAPEPSLLLEIGPGARVSAGGLGPLEPDVASAAASLPLEPEPVAGRYRIAGPVGGSFDACRGDLRLDSVPAGLPLPGPVTTAAPFGAAGWGRLAWSAGPFTGDVDAHLDLVGAGCG